VYVPPVCDSISLGLSLVAALQRAYLAVRRSRSCRMIRWISEQSRKSPTIIEFDAAIVISTGSVAEPRNRQLAQYLPS